MRKLALGVLGLAAASTAHAAVVTFTLSLNEGPNFTAQANSFAVYATVSGGDNFGLFGYGVDMMLPSEGGPSTLTIMQRSPVGHWSINDTDPNWDPDAAYPDKVAGFSLFRSISATGAVSGNQDISKYDPARGDGSLPCGSELVVMRGIGQTPGSMNSLIPGKARGLDGTCSVGWKPFTRDGSPASDLAYGTPFNPPGLIPLPAGSIRLFTGTWTGSVKPSIQATVDTKAGVWHTNATGGPEAIQVDVATVNTALRFPEPPLLNVFTVGSTAVGTQRATDGHITVTGSNGGYVSEIDQLTTDANNGTASVQTIGDEAGTLYVMANVTGIAADVSAILNQFSNAAGDAQASSLHAAYDSQFGPTGFNLLFKTPNFAGAKNINWDFSSNSGAVVNQLAIVPEPATMGWMAFAGMGLLARRRRKE